MSDGSFNRGCLAVVVIAFFLASMFSEVRFGIFVPTELLMIFMFIVVSFWFYQVYDYGVDLVTLNCGIGNVLCNPSGVCPINRVCAECPFFLEHSKKTV